MPRSMLITYIVSAATALVAGPTLSSGYTITGLFPPGANTGITSLDINNSGEITGNWSNSNGDYTGYRWKNGNFTPIEAWSGGSSHTGRRINDLGWITGTSVVSGQQQSLLWKDLTPEMIKPNSFPYGLNNLGTIVGQDFNTNLAYSIKNGVQQPLGGLGGSRSTAMDVNDSEVVVGWATQTNGVGRAAKWNNGFISNIDNISGSLGSRAMRINRNNTIMGDFAVNPGTGVVRHLFINDGSGSVDIGSLPGFSSSLAADMNNSSNIVGYSYNSIDNPTAILWKDGSFFDLNNLIQPGSGWLLSTSVAINDSGQIVGIGSYHGVTAAYLLTPVPEPSSLIALALGFAGSFGLCLRRNKH